MARLSGGWARLKTIGDVSPVLILVNKTTGQFGTTIDQGATIKEWPTMAAAEQFVKEINEADAVDVVMVESLGDHVPCAHPTRVRKTGRFWTKMDGTGIQSHYLSKYFLPDPLVLARIEEIREQHDGLRKVMHDLCDQAWDLVKTMQPLEK